MIFMTSPVASCTLFSKYPHKIWSTVPSMNSNFMLHVLVAHPYDCYFPWLDCAVSSPNLRKVYVYSVPWPCIYMGRVGVRGPSVVQEHRKCFDIENTTLCHLSDDCIPTKLGTYNEMHFTGMVFISQLSTCGVPSCHVLHIV